MDDLDAGDLELADRWILSRTQHAVTATTTALDRYRVNDAAEVVYHFIWDDLADWYVEQVKPRLYCNEAGGDVARRVLHEAFATASQRFRWRRSRSEEVSKDSPSHRHARRCSLRRSGVFQRLDWPAAVGEFVGYPR